MADLRSGAITMPGWLGRSTLLRHLTMAVLAGAVLAGVINSVGQYRQFQIAQVAAYVIAVAGLSMLIGQSGQISIGNSAFMAVGGYAGALLFVHRNWNLAEILPAATVVAAIAGAIFGLAAARLRGPYLAGATLMLAVALPSLATMFPGVLGADQGLNFYLSVPTFLGPNFSLQLWQTWVTCGTVLLSLVLLANLLRSRIGRHWRAVRDDEIAASLAGLNVPRLQILAFTVSAACGGLAGTLIAYVGGTVTPGLYSLTISIQLLTAAVLGGLGSIPGAVWGSAAAVLLPTYLQNLILSHGFSASVSSNVPIAAYGVVLIVVMLVFPRGIQGGLNRLFGPARQAISAQTDLQPPAPKPAKHQPAEQQKKG